MNRNQALAAAFLAALGVSPALADTQVIYSQPAVIETQQTVVPVQPVAVSSQPMVVTTTIANDPIDQKQCCIQSKLDAAIKMGALDDTQMASLQRDLDGVKVREENFRSRNDGLTSGGRRALNDQLDRLANRLARQTQVTTVETAVYPAGQMY